MIDFKRCLFISLIGFGVILIIMGVVIGLTSPKKEKNIYKPESGISETYKYLLKEYNGKIGIFETGSDTPIQIIDIPINTLPEEDIKSLKLGIRVKDVDALNKIIEDFES